MTESDRSDAEEENMDKLELSSDSTDFTTKKKRSRVEDSEDEAKDLPTKKQPSSFNEQTEMLEVNNAEAISDKNGIHEYNIKEKKHKENEQNEHEESLCESNMDWKKEKQDKSVKQENWSKSPLKNDDLAMDEDPVKAKIIKENIKSEVSPSRELTANANTSTFEDEKIEKGSTTVVQEFEKKSKEDKMKEERIIKSQTMDTEVVDGLELSVECASDKEEQSSESEDEKDTKPRPKTIIVKAEPNKSELECSSSEEKKSDLQDTEIKPEKKKIKRRGARTSFSKMKASGSEDSQNNNSDEDYSPRTKKRMKKSPTTRRSTKRSTESRRGRGGSAKRNSSKKSAKYMSDDENADAISEEKVDKSAKGKNETEDELSEKESSRERGESNSEDSETSTKGRKTKRSNRPEDNKQIQKLKKYLNIAGVRVRYNDVWADCKSNAAKIRRLKELLEKNGISGRPTLEKCKRVKEKNEKIREVSELDVSNIISEGRVTRARRNMDNGKKATPPETPPRHREARNTLKRIRTVIDSDSD